MEERRGRGKSRNRYRELMGMDKGGIDCGNGGEGIGTSKGEKGETTVTEQQQKIKIKKIIKILFSFLKKVHTDYLHLRVV